MPTNVVTDENGRVVSFTIPRAKWLRGGKDGDGRLSLSELLNLKGHQCCVGHYLSACGVIGLLYVSTAHRLPNLPEQARWLGSGGTETSSAAYLYRTNDTSVNSEPAIISEFAKQGIEVKFE